MNGAASLSIARVRIAPAWVAIAGAVSAVALLASLHVLSPEFDPSWRVVSEYANGHYGWVLSLMFACWAVSSWALAVALRPYVKTLGAWIGLWILVIAGVGEAIAAAFDINQPMHAVADLLGAGGLPVAAMVLTVSLRRTYVAWRSNRLLLWLANITWVSVVATMGSVLLLFVTFVHAGGHIPADGKSLPLGTILPAGAIALVGYTNRLMVVAGCAWSIVAACQVMQDPEVHVRHPPQL